MLCSTFCVFSEAAREAAELGETGPEHGLEHQVGGGHLCLGVSPRVSSASHSPGWLLGKLPAQTGPLRCTEVLSQWERNEGSAFPCPCLHNLI